MKYLSLLFLLLFTGCAGLLSAFGYSKDPDAVGVFDNVSLGNILTDGGTVAVGVILHNLYRNMTRKSLQKKIVAELSPEEPEATSEK